jgi:membrane protein implicated in regulation of membrane protease activity
MALWQEWWVWMLAGAVLAILEVLLPGFILLGFAIGAALTGALLWLGVIGGSLGTLLLVIFVVALWLTRSQREDD